MTKPTSWFAIEPGWEVVDCSGERVGRVSHVVGDEDADIFDGLRFTADEGEEHFVEGAHVGEIVEGRVTLTTDLGQLEQSGAEEPGGAEITRDRDVEL
jgi:hypothetical protein